MTSIESPGDAVEAGESAESADADLVLRTRSGDRAAFGELWYRHYRSGITVARSVSPGLDADDLVQEAYARIYQSILRGGGPTGSFRAYLFTSIRNTAAAWGRGARENTVDLLDTVEDPATSDEATDAALDRSLTHRAFRSLPTRWQEVLWYTEIEQMKPAEVAPLLGMKPTAVAQLAFRAREGLREAWIQAHLKSVEDGSDCQWAIERLGAHARENLSRRDRRKVDDHLVGCARCTIVAAEAKVVSSRLALVLLPLALGATGTAAYLATLQGGGVPAVALAAGTSPVVPTAFGAVKSAGLASTGWSGAGSSSTTAGSTAAGASTALGASTAAASTTGATLTAVGLAATAGGAAGLLSGIGAFLGVTTAAAVLVGSALSASVAAPSTFEHPTSSPAVAASSVQNLDDTLSAPAPEAVGGDEELPGDGTTPPSLPTGMPSASGAAVSFTGTQPTFTVTLTGDAGATVEVLLNGAVASTAVLDDGGTGSGSFVPTYGQVNSDARVGLRYRVGAWSGSARTMRLSDLADLPPILAAMKPQAGQGAKAGANGEAGNGRGAGGSNANGNGNANANSNANGNGNININSNSNSSGSSNANANSNGNANANGNGSGKVNGNAGNGNGNNSGATGTDGTATSGNGTAGSAGTNRSGHTSDSGAGMTGDSGTGAGRSDLGSAGTADGAGDPQTAPAAGGSGVVVPPVVPEGQAAPAV